MISGVVITLNEEDHIAACIDSLWLLVGEVIVVDSGSTDKTVSIARSKGAKVHTITWSGYGASKNFGAEKANNEWIFSLDADERCEGLIADTLKSITLDPSMIYQFKRHNRLNDKEMKYGFLAPEWKSRLYHKTHYSWNDRLVHESLVSKAKGGFVKLPGIIDHFAYDSLSDLNRRLDRYSFLNAKAWILEKSNPGFISRTFGPSYHFLRSYLFKLGIFEGKMGYDVSKAAYVYNLKKHKYYKDFADSE